MKEIDEKRCWRPFFIQVYSSSGIPLQSTHVVTIMLDHPLTESVQRCSVAAEQLVAAEQMPKGRKKYAAL